MNLIEEISVGVIGEFRESQKGKLQRHFVSGRDVSKLSRLLIPFFLCSLAFRWIYLG
jgi:hypothetical protein